MYAELAIGGSKGGKKAATTGKAKPKPKAKAPAKKTTTAKGKGKAKQIVLDSEEDDELASSEPGGSGTLRDDTMDLDDDDGDDGFGGESGRGSKSSSVSSRRKAAPAKRTARKAAPQTIMIDDSDSDSDSGLTFKVSTVFRSRFRFVLNRAKRFALSLPTASVSAERVLLILCCLSVGFREEVIGALRNNFQLV